MGLTADQIAELMSSTRTKGGYEKRLNDFIASGAQGVQVSEEYPEFRGKKAGTVKQGFVKATENKNAPEGSDQVLIRATPDSKEEGGPVGEVFLINLALVGANATE